MILCWSAIHHHESVIDIRMAPPSWTSLPPHPILYVVTEHRFKLPESYSKFPVAIYFTYSTVCFHASYLFYIQYCMFSRYSLNSSYHLLPPLCPQICSLCLCFPCCLGNRFISIICLVFSCQVMSDSLQPHGLQHTRPTCPSPSPRVCPSSCPLNWWCHPTFSSSIALFFCLQSFPASDSFLVIGVFMSDGQVIGASASASAFPMSIQGLFPLGLTALMICIDSIYMH